MTSALTLTAQFDLVAQLPVPVVLVEVVGGESLGRVWANTLACPMAGGEITCGDGWTEVEGDRLELAGLPVSRLCADALAGEAATIETSVRRADGRKRVRFTFSSCRATAVGGDFLVGIGTELGEPAEDEGSGDGHHAEVVQTLAEIENLALIGHYVEYPESGRTEWSPGLERVRAFASGKRPASFAELAETIYPEDAIAVAAQEADERWRRTGMEFRVIRPDGSIRHVYRYCYRDAAPDGRIVRVFGIEQDITEFRLAEKELSEAKVAAEAASKSKTEFLAHMSHELRTPLNAIKGFSEVMAQQMFGPLSERYLDYIQQVHKSAEDLWLRIDYILDLARIEDGQYELGKEHVDFGQITTEVAAMLEDRAREKGIALEVSTDGPRHLWAEGRALKTIVHNLIDNALKFTKSGGSVFVETGIDAGRAFLRVRDTGVGIPERDLARVCDPFFQSRAGVESAGETGTGLGLAITKSLVDLHEGFIQIESEQGRGSTLTIFMPMRGYSPGFAQLTNIQRA